MQPQSLWQSAGRLGRDPSRSVLGKFPFSLFVLTGEAEQAIPLSEFQRDVVNIHGFSPGTQAVAGSRRCDLHHVDRRLADRWAIWYSLIVRKAKTPPPQSLWPECRAAGPPSEEELLVILIGISGLPARNQPEPTPCVVVPGVLSLPCRYAPSIVIVIVVVLAVTSPPGQITAVLYALATVLALAGMRKGLA